MVVALGSRELAPTRVPSWKRRLDIACILMSLPLTLPLMAVMLIWIKLISPGPAVLSQRRMGWHGQPFTLYKFRSMQTNADTGRQENYVRRLVKTNKPLVKLDNLSDSRLITGGWLMRAAGLDELPQLWNVLRGEMSLVGPRPCLPTEYKLFAREQRERFNVLPGLSGVWQVDGKDRATFNEMILMDIHYVRHASVWVDLRTLLRTPAAVGRQIYQATRRKCEGLMKRMFTESVHENADGDACARNPQAP